MTPSLTLICALPNSLTFELRNGACFESDTPHQILVNGAQVLSTTRNVFTLRGLMSATDHRVEVRSGGKSFKTTARTAPLSVVLHPEDFGAKGDGVADDTRALQAALSACPPDGVVRLAKTYLSGPLFLKSRMNLEILKGAKLLGVRDIAQWPILPGILYDEQGIEKAWLGSWEGQPQGCHAALLNILSASQVSIYGEGLIDGQAGFDTWWAHPKTPYSGSWRPRLIFCVDSDNLTFEGFTLANSPSWNLHPLHCRQVTAACLNITAPANSPNTDGFDPESCEDVVGAGIHFTVGDDCIAIKSGKIEMAKKALRPTRGVHISNCWMQDGHGGVTLGSEMAAGVYGVVVRDCRFTGTDRGVRVKTRRGRGKDAIVKGAWFDNIEMNGVGTAFVINSFYWADADGKTDYVGSRAPQPVSDLTPWLGGFKLTHIRCENVRNAVVYLLGLPEQPIEGIDIDGLYARFDPAAKPEPPDMAASIPPELHRGIYIVNARHIRLRHIDIEGQAGDKIHLENVS
ncbi:glycoside hydrolase family 28 protein [Asticcacaulis sp. EMRT-3]|uniref:glycoside hydrolase family 28 protein n=1 Tax=Asticcacaulis sp. EMRT-3 TaxID=3040349 RepID=UPI0024AFB1E8|nr:glycoside hydrolase family 28 protein [Asticcacaulis sp. EMRT-3]MDI7776484.1 glycoside hydrolase family 28 protein [Asticcacaulis sp. EMRT-3]